MADEEVAGGVQDGSGDGLSFAFLSFFETQ
jgi:hypothetical protein